MTPRAVALLAAACLSAAVESAAVNRALQKTASKVKSKVSPINKCLEMLQDVLTKGVEDKRVEERQFSKYKFWCDQTRKEKTRDIANGKTQVLTLVADIEKAKSDADALAEDITELQATISALETDVKKSTAVRKKGNTDFKAVHKDFSESINAIERAIVVLKQRSADVPQTLLQLRSSTLIPERAKAAVESFLDTDVAAVQAADAPDSSLLAEYTDASSSGEGEEALEAPKANAYESQGGGVIDLLERLRKKFKEELFDAEKQEMNQRNSFELLLQQMTDDLKRKNDVVATKTTAKTGRLQDAAASKGDLDTVKTTLAVDEKAMMDCLTQCAARSEEYEKNQVVRANEIKTVQEAIRILKSDTVSGSADKHLSLAQEQDSSVLAQLRTSGGEDPNVWVRQRVASLLEAQAKKLDSRYLSILAVRVTQDPFEKVKTLIKDLIVKLMEEAVSEADKKGFCDTELTTNKQTREDKTAEIEDLNAQIEKDTALSATLATELAELAAAVAETLKFVKEATQMRGEEKAKNAATIDDAKAGQAAVETAIRVMKEFYQGTSSFVQEGATTSFEGDMEEARSNDPYSGQQSKSTGIIGMLDVILSDFARLETETSESEDLAQKEYDEFVNESEKDTAVKDTETKYKEEKKQRTDEQVRDLTKELGLTQRELDEAIAYFEKLKPDCLDMGLSYEERVRQRKEEIVSLQEALKVISGEALP